MKRGVITLSGNETRTAYSVIGAAKFESDPIRMKLKAAFEHEGEQEFIELSEDEAETLLDCLPVPNAAEQHSLSGLREKVSRFLSELRMNG